MSKTYISDFINARVIALTENGFWYGTLREAVIVGQSHTVRLSKARRLAHPFLGTSELAAAQLAAGGVVDVKNRPVFGPAVECVIGGCYGVMLCTDAATASIDAIV